jgi:hypothetical protein
MEIEVSVEREDAAEREFRHFREEDAGIGSIFSAIFKLSVVRKALHLLDMASGRSVRAP